MKINLKFLNKISDNFSLKSEKQYLFWFLALLMLMLVGAFVIYNFVFLISNFNEALAPALSAPPDLRFDIKGFEELSLTK